MTRVGKLLRCAMILATFLLCLVLLRPVSEAQNPAASATFAKSIQPFLAKHCYMCHNTKVKSGGLDLKSYQNVAAILNDRDNWEHVLQKVRSAEMPPEGMPRPGKAEIAAFTRAVEQEFARAERLVKPDPGRVTARRLNRAEYNNTVRDLLGVDFRPADDFPQDDSGYGFDNIGDVLSLSPVLMEKYLTAAEKIARTAIFGYEPLKPTLVRLRTPGQKIDASHKPLFDYDVSGLGLPNAIHATHRFPVEGEYNIRAFLGGVRPAGSEPLQLAFWVDGKQIQVINFDPDGVASFSNDRQDFGGMAQDFRTRFSAGEHWIAISILRLYEGLPPSFAGPNPSRRPTPPPPEFKPPRNLPPERIAAIKKNFEARRAEKIPVNEARISALEIGGPYTQNKGAAPESLKNIYACGHLNGNHLAGCEQKIISHLAHRAFRRPVTAEEVNRLVGLVAMARQKGDSFEEGLCLAMQAILVSPHFLFRIEKDAATSGADNSFALSQHELASRLSYFLWSSMPDEELLGCADQGTLRKPAVLTAQVRRMLKDPKSRALVENFGGQWLELRRLESAKPDRELFPQFSEYLRMSMRRETELFFESIVREDRSIIDFINGDFTFLNEQLARFYKIPDVKGPEFRRVALTGDTQRGGILTQASVLTVSSYATRTSPVLRGKWILENLLNAAPPPPPADVPNLDESKVASSASLRQQLEEHRKNVTCASCHSRMDPLGFGLENFDAIGGWRAEDGKQPIDSSGTLPDGRSFKGARELKAILQQDRDAFAECLTEKLLTYALGRGLERYDNATVKKISGRLAANNYRFSSLVLEIVNSLPFQKRRGDKTS
jgi:hypothetical protein